ncbi:cytochrome C oxidase subunit IV family protein [Rhodoplanes sp. TEM]|uniref:Cytochrome C oxidase subunit IV family protein n=1 Tax=Rhodoplanes tepidamans TaxID=200616 RepID=A0ABT5JFU0_RHOTP|nr:MULTISPECIES: cytochrome C oxidase subunit IV family protein [Rhodoplanes]MDC7788477.1 cytochrome C oxidase subunit IV family protein [Rhodoplanes tepidamans]MDC7987975.1 cytochrome C oxidase subunit IV family protein [Rhodoplanes sp. TEM]MDQ0358599.1 uncharacterized membrane protein YgdD (TMEM256/DUF423 family) [Rhodoplanes tepidamans]
MPRPRLSRPRLSRPDAAAARLIVLALASLAVTVAAPAGAAANALVIGAAVLKGRIVVLDFLGLRTAPPLWRGLVGGWGVLVGTLAWLAAAAALLR